MSVSSQVQRQLFFILLFIQGEPLPNVEDCGRTGQLPGVNVHARTELHKSNKNSSR